MATNPFPDSLIEQAKQERERLLRQIEESQKTIARSQQILAEIDILLAQAGKVNEGSSGP